MSDRNPIEPREPKAAARTLPCEEWEALLADAVDGTLSSAETAAFEAHTSTCAACRELLSRAKQGQEWLQFLAQPPVSPDLVSKILARTSGAAATGVGAPGLPVPQPVLVPLWRRVATPASMRRMAEPRLMMTAAMAFFSVALTLNLAGVRLSAVRLSDLNPSMMRNNLTRQFINSKVGVENYCYNLKIVYEMEARVRELKRSTDSEEAQPPARQQTPAASPKGSAHKSGGKSENPRAVEPRAALWGQSVEAILHSAPIGTAGEGTLPDERSAGQQQAESKQQAGDRAGTTPKSCVRPETDRAEGSLA